MPTAIALHDVVKHYRATKAVDGVTLDIGNGITGLLGPNGAGKTTLMRMVATVLGPDAGSVSLFGSPLTDATAREASRRRLGYLPQEPGFHRGFTCFEFLDYIAILKAIVVRDARHGEVRRVLEVVGLASSAGTRIRALSGGMRRRLGIAQALLGDPDLLVLDEPTAGLDPEQRLRFRELLTERLADRTVLLSTHQTDDVAALCSRVIVMLDGTVRYDGTPSGLTEQADGRVWSAAARDPSAQLAWVGGDGMARHIGEPPPGAQLVPPTIEDGYLLLVGRRAHEAAA